ncbi:DUF4194 domain-containing protein [Luteipulveratus mongoliensis]|uniref:DUF4194 domain-containing protein n=1 Tax=Luteipulveratus mongoliensis TaxID=571913 RepID=UPI000698C7A5|nr:DUF4194 domain-containing protein [Luteipulveratus mongoliensis]
MTEDGAIEWEDGEDGESPALFEGDRGTLPLEARKALVLLLKRTHLNGVSRPAEWRALLAHRGDVTARLHDMFLELVIDVENEVAYKRQAGRELGRMFTTLLTDRAYTREEAALLLHLRGEHRNARRRGDPIAYVERNDLADAVSYVRPAETMDHVRADEAVVRAIDALLREGFLMRDPSDPDRLQVSPVIETLLTTERTKEFVHSVRTADDVSTSEDATVESDVLDEDLGVTIDE